MKEILYIAGIDGRPWVKAIVGESLIPFLLLFASVETTRAILNEEVKISEFNRYFVIIIVAIALVNLGRLLPANWHRRYTMKFMQDLIYCVLISTALFNAFSTFFPIRWSLLLDPSGRLSDQCIRIVIAISLSVIGVAYLGAATYLHRRAEATIERMRSHLFISFRRRERAALACVLFGHFIASCLLLGFLLVKES